MGQTPQRNRLIFVTGLSGAGKSTALKALEDSGFETIDNLPLTVIESVVARVLPETNLAIGVDCRSRGFSAEILHDITKRLADAHDLVPAVIFMDASASVLIQRFSETRRRHPLSVDTPIEDGIATEMAQMEPVRAFASQVFDTSFLSTTDTRLMLKERIGGSSDKLVVTLMSFGFSKGVPRGADLIFDVRFLKNPHYDPDLRPLTGRDVAVQDFVKQDTGFDPFVEKIDDLLDFLLPRYHGEGKSYVTIAFGCTGGRHRSVTMVETFARQLSRLDLDIHCWHRDSIC